MTRYTALLKMGCHFTGLNIASRDVALVSIVTSVEKPGFHGNGLITVLRYYLLPWLLVMLTL